jgi:pyruvate/2-oxoglutarate dehydrogenase complex dihydrolipoamide acyltransferase (E2) component
MPFYGYTGIPSPEDPKQHVPGTVIKWLVAEGSYVRADTKIAEVEINGHRHHVVICFEALIEKELTKEGSTSERDTSLLKWDADGDNIPYGRAYFVTKPK